MATLQAMAPVAQSTPAHGAPTRVRHGVLGFTLVLTAVAYLDRVCIATGAPAIKLDLHLSDAQMGYVFSAFTFAYALFEIPSGWLADRFGARLMLTRIVIWWSAMTAATGLASGFTSLLTLRLLFGLGVEIGGRHAGVVTGAMNTFGNLGGSLSPVAVGLCLQRWGSWNLPLFTVAAFYLVAAACWLRIDPTDPIPNT